MPVAFRNTKPGPTVFSIPEDKIVISWGGAGDPAGNDIQEVSDDIVKNPNFRRNVSRGTFVEVTREDYDEAFIAQMAAHSDRSRNVAEQTLATIDHVANNDLLSQGCQGPGARATSSCNVEVPVRASDQGKAPVLCPKHAHLVGQFIEVPTSEMIEVEGKLVAKTIWAPVSVDNRTSDRGI